ncbi:MAG TPA: BON domain-containing protein [Chloroflexota bacterium]|nr:BON domain-containing protein [Chloroflexota bacterium]
MKWLVGFVLGVLGGWALGYAAGPRGSRLAACGLSRWLGGAGADSLGRAGSADAARRYDGLLEDDRLTRVARARIQERDIDDLRVDVTTVDGVMYLRGRPRTARDAAAIVDVAETTPGVTKVVNELKPLDQEAAPVPAAKSGT